LRKRFSDAYFMPQPFLGEHPSHEILPPKILFPSGVIRIEQLHKNPKLQTINL